MKKMLLMVLTIPLLLLAKEEMIGYLGVGIVELSEAMKTALDIEYGILVDKVYEESPAEKADIQVGDIILEIDAEKIADHKTLKQAVRAKPNEKITIQIYRAKKKITKTVVLGEKEAKKIDMPNIEVNIPDIEELKKMIIVDKEKLTEELEQLKEELEQLKHDLKELKDKYKK